MDYTSDSDLSDDTRDLVSRGLASVKRKRRIVTTQSDGVHDRFSESNMDTSNVRHPSWCGVSIGDTSTHGLATASVETAISQKHNNGTVKMGLEVIEPRSARRESSSSVAERLRRRPCNQKIAGSNPASGHLATPFRKEI